MSHLQIGGLYVLTYMMPYTLAVLVQGRLPDHSMFGELFLQRSVWAAIITAAIWMIIDGSQITVVFMGIQL